MTTYAEIRDLAMADLIADPRQVVYAADALLDHVEAEIRERQKRSREAITDMSMDTSIRRKAFQHGLDEALLIVQEARS